MPDINIKYSGQSIDSLSATGSKTLQTSGKFCESDFTIEYTKPTPKLQSKSVTPATYSQTITPDSSYDGLSQVAVTAMPSGSTKQNAPTINTSTGLVTATSTVSRGYQSASTKSNTLQLTTQAAQTITPTTTDQTIASGQYLTGTQTIKGDANLVAANIAQGVSMFGVSGSYTSDADATAADILSGKTAYVNGSKVTGSISIATTTETRTYLGIT